MKFRERVQYLKYVAQKFSRLAYVAIERNFSSALWQLFLICLSIQASLILSTIGKQYITVKQVSVHAREINIKLLQQSLAQVCREDIYNVDIYSQHVLSSLPETISKQRA